MSFGTTSSKLLPYLPYRLPARISFHQTGNIQFGDIQHGSNPWRFSDWVCKWSDRCGVFHKNCNFFKNTV